MLLVITTLLIACGGEEKKVEAVAPPPPVVAPAPPVAAPAPVATPPADAAPAAPSGPYAPNPLAQAAYDAAKAAGADKVAKNPKAGDAAAIAGGKAQYAKCAACHGEQGKGDGIAGAALPQKPSNFHDKSRWDYTTPGVKHWILLNGVKGTAMAPLGLTEDQAWEVLAYIESEFVGK